jgi:hypothetical protein
VLFERNNELWYSFYRYPRVLEGYCDANWISDTDELYATSGYEFLLGSGAIS